MKKIITLLFAFAFVTANAQITITVDDLPQDGYTYLTVTDTVTNVSLGTPGPTAQNWDFSNLTSHYPSVPTFGLTSTTQYANAFAPSNLYTFGPAAMFGGFYGGAPVGEVGLSNGYMFWKTDVTGYYVIGFRSEAGIYANRNVLVDPMEMLIGTPATYGTTQSNSSHWELSMNLNPADVDTFYNSYVSKTFLADAWGSLTTPYGTFPDVLRIHEYAVEVDSVTAVLGSLTVYSLELSRDTVNNYLYLTNTKNYPVAMVSADKNFNIRKVEYYNGEVMTGVAETTKEEQSLAVWPNPAQNRVSIGLSNPSVFSKGVLQLQLVDMLGQVVHTDLIESTNKEVALDNLMSGLYMIRCIQQGNVIGSQKLLITE